VTCFIIAPYKYSYLLTYLFTSNVVTHIKLRLDINLIVTLAKVKLREM